jgi:hypothetical protein
MILYRKTNPLKEERIHDLPITSDGSDQTRNQNYLKRRVSKAERKEKCSQGKERCDTATSRPSRQKNKLLIKRLK